MSNTRRPISAKTSASRRATRRRGLTLVEVLATIVLMAIVLPAAMQGISSCLATSISARQRAEAAALAEAKLGELIATGDWEFGVMSGEFGQAWPEYRWSAGASGWASDTTMREISVRVYWTSRQQEREVVLTTLLYQSTTETAASL